MGEVASLHARLPRIAAGEAEARNRILAALNGLEADALTLRARLAAPWEGAPALLFDTGAGVLGLAPERIEGQPAAALAAAAPSLPETLSEMSRLEPVIAAIERCCGRALDPCGLAAPDAGGLDLAVEALDGEGQPVHALRLIVPEALAAGFAQTGRRALGLAADARTAVHLTLQGPAPPRSELALLEAGDVVLLPGGLQAGRAARLAAGRIVLHGGLDLTTALFHAHREDAVMFDASATEAAPSPDAFLAPDAASAPLADLPVRLQVVLPQMEMPVGLLAGLAPGAVAPLPIEGESLKVDLLAAGVRIATGQLVALGSAYGVLIEAVARDGPQASGAVDERLA